MVKCIDVDALKEKLDAEIKIEEEVTNLYMGSKLKSNARIDGLKFAKCVIDEMPTTDVEPVRKWILCSEKLPEEGKDVLFLFVSGNQQVGARECGSWWSNFTERNAIEEWDVIAWMPLPEPPKMDGGSK